jgi:hypothetical protein
MADGRWQMVIINHNLQKGQFSSDLRRVAKESINLKTLKAFFGSEYN